MQHFSMVSYVRCRRTMTKALLCLLSIAALASAAPMSTHDIHTMAQRDIIEGMQQLRVSTFSCSPRLSCRVSFQDTDPFAGAKAVHERLTNGFSTQGGCP